MYGNKYLTAYANINSKLINSLTIRPGTVKLLKENIGKSFMTLFFSMILLRFDTKSKAAKTKIHKSDYIKIKIFYIAKEINNKIKEQFIKWKKNSYKPCIYKGVNVQIT